MIETLTRSRELSPQKTFGQLYDTCRRDGIPQQVCDALVTRLEYAFFTINYPEFSSTEEYKKAKAAINKIHKIGQSFSHASSQTHGRIIDFNVMSTDGEYGLATVKTPTERPYSIIKMIDQIDFNPMELTGTYIARSNEDPDAPLEMINVFEDEPGRLSLAALTEQDKLEVEYYLQGAITEA